MTVFEANDDFWERLRRFIAMMKLPLKSNPAVLVKDVLAGEMTWNVSVVIWLEY